MTIKKSNNGKELEWHYKSLFNTYWLVFLFVCLSWQREENVINLALNTSSLLFIYLVITKSQQVRTIHLEVLNEVLRRENICCIPQGRNTGGRLQNCLSLCPVSARCLTHGSILLCDDWWKSSWVTDEIQFLFPTLKGAVEKQTSLTFLIHSPEGEHMHGKHLHPHTPSFAPSSSGDPLLWLLSLEKERAVPFGASVWNTCCLPAPLRASVSSERVAGCYLAQGRQVPREGSPGWYL